MTQEYSRQLAVILLAIRESRAISREDKENAQNRFVSKSLDEETSRELLRRIPSSEFSRAERIIDDCYSTGITPIILRDETYPAHLSSLIDPPLILFVRGTLPPETASRTRIAIVGTRKPSQFGRDFTRALSNRITNANAIVISGLAYGIDASAHEGAIEAATRSSSRDLHPGVAVLGSGLNEIYPKSHERLARDLIDAGGALISEYVPNAGPRKHQFPERNRIISGLSSATIVVEAMIRSGALVTARFAAEQGREVFAVPGAIRSELSWGPNQLLKEGASPLTEPEDLEKILPAISKSKPQSPPSTDLSPEESKLVAYIKTEGVSSSESIADYFNLPLPKAEALIMQLELRGLLLEDFAGRYSLRITA